MEIALGLSWLEFKFNLGSDPASPVCVKRFFGNRPATAGIMFITPP